MISLALLIGLAILGYFIFTQTNIFGGKKQALPFPLPQFSMADVGKSISEMGRSTAEAMSGQGKQFSEMFSAMNLQNLGALNVLQEQQAGLVSGIQAQLKLQQESVNQALSRAGQAGGQPPASKPPAPPAPDWKTIFNKAGVPINPIKTIIEKDSKISRVMGKKMFF